jgi:hypothetical protein
MTPRPEPTPATRWAPILLSGLVYPGAGQLLQKRWLAATFFIILSTALFVWVGIEMARALAAYLLYVADPYRVPPPVAQLLRALVPFGLLLLVFGVNLLDAALACRRSGRGGETTRDAVTP